MEPTWQEIGVLMKTLENDVKKNSKTKDAQRSFQTPANQPQPQQQVVTYLSTTDATITSVDNVEREEII